MWRYVSGVGGLESDRTKLMDEEAVEKFAEHVVGGDAVFIPSHLTKAMVATGVCVGAGAISLLAGGYALWEYKKVTFEEVAAMVKPPK